MESPFWPRLWHLGPQVRPLQPQTLLPSNCQNHPQIKWHYGHFSLKNTCGASAVSTCHKPLIALSHYLRGSPCFQPRLRKGHCLYIPYLGKERCGKEGMPKCLKNSCFCHLFLVLMWSGARSVCVWSSACKLIEIHTQHKHSNEDEPNVSRDSWLTWPFDTSNAFRIFWFARNITGSHWSL